MEIHILLGANNFFHSCSITIYKIVLKLHVVRNNYIKYYEYISEFANFRLISVILKDATVIQV